MNDEARKMMLLASIDGVEADLPRMILVKDARYVKHQHVTDQTVSSGFDYTTQEYAFRVKEHVIDLRVMGFDGEKIGSVGMCQCGQVYYSLENKKR